MWCIKLRPNTIPETDVHNITGKDNMRIILTIYIFFFTISCFAIKVRFRDYISFQGKKYILENNILMAYFKLHPKKIPEPDLYYANTNKQYSANFEVRESKIYLIGFFINRNTSKDTMNKSLNSIQFVNVIREVFDNADEVEMTGVTANLILRPDYQKDSIITHRKSCLHVIIKNGAIQKTKKIFLNGIKRLQKKLFRMFKLTNEYVSLTEEYRSLGYDSELTKAVVFEEIFSETVKFN